MAYRLLNDMRLALFRKLDALAPAYLTRRRSGDLVAVATHDVELIEYFFAHTVTPVLVAIIVPLAVLGTLAMFGWPLAVALLPFLLYAALSPLLRRAHIDQLGSRAREVSGDLSAHTVDSIQGMAEIVAFQRERARGEEPVPVRDGPGVPAPGPTDTMLTLRDVTFTYPGRRRPALTGVSLSVPSGSTVALVGSSGAGKTTIAHLCLRFWDCDAGEI